MIRLLGTVGLCALGAFPIGAAEAQSRAGANVWVNTRSGAYHCPGAPTYGKTARGEVMSELVARERGFRPAGGAICGPLPEFDALPSKPAQPTSECKVTSIEDGDTIICDPVGRIRLTGIDAPEGKQQPFGDQATAGLAALMPVGSVVEVETDRQVKDRYGRTLAYLWFRGTMVNWLMIRQGWAVSAQYPGTIRYAGLFVAAESRAELEKGGLWAGNGFKCRPGEFRKKKC